MYRIEVTRVVKYFSSSVPCDGVLYVLRVYCGEILCIMAYCSMFWCTEVSSIVVCFYYTAD